MPRAMLVVVFIFDITLEEKLWTITTLPITLMLNPYIKTV